MTITGRWRRAFNSPLESGLRALCLLVEAYPAPLGLQRLLQYEYLSIHSGDADGPPSLHPAIPHRSGELLVRRGIVEHGVVLMATRGLVERSFGASGILYTAAETAAPFLDGLTAGYTQSLRERSAWVVNRFAALPERDLDDFMRARWVQWGSEFLFDPVKDAE
jgi:hypothetical protein